MGVASKVRTSILTAQVPQDLKGWAATGYLSLEEAVTQTGLQPWEPNLPLLRQALALIEELAAHDDGNIGPGEHWSQADWVEFLTVYGEPASEDDESDLCGTSACFCGWALLLAGVAIDREGIYLDYRTPVGGQSWSGSWERAGASLLGLPEPVASRLFSGGNTLSDIQETLDEFLNGLGYLDWRNSDERDSTESLEAAWNWHG